VLASLELPITRPRGWMLGLFAAGTVLTIPGHSRLLDAGKGELALAAMILGLATLAACAWLAWKDAEPALRRRMLVLLGVVLILAAADINTSLETSNFIWVSVPFFLAVAIPAFVLARTDPGVIRYRFWPRTFRKLDVFYTVLSIPLAWAVFQFYWWVNPEQYQQWTLPAGMSKDEQIARLFLGINMVGIWDELFFVNTVFAILRSLFAFKIANAFQAVVYAAVLTDMAFIGIGPVLVYLFAWTQGSMFEKSENLLFVLIVHLIVDFFLVAAIVHSYDPTTGLDYLWRHGM